jgi:ArsR family transcriptional regulator
MPSRKSARASSRRQLDRHLRPELFRALGDPTRVEVLRRLLAAPEPLTVSDIADCCGVHLSGVSRHLSALKDAGIIRSEKHGREVRYILDWKHFVDDLRGLADAIDACRTACCPGGS